MKMGKESEGMIVWGFCFSLFLSCSKVGFLFPLKRDLLPLVTDARGVGNYCAVFKCCRDVSYSVDCGPSDGEGPYSFSRRSEWRTAIISINPTLIWSIKWRKTWLTNHKTREELDKLIFSKQFNQMQLIRPYNTPIGRKCALYNLLVTHQLHNSRSTTAYHRFACIHLLINT